MKRIATVAFALSLPCAAFGEEPTTLKEVTVTAKSADVAERRDDTSQKVILDRKEVENLGVMTIGEVLGKLPGVEVNGEGQRARGMSRDSVQILIDGERPAGGSRMVAGVIGRLPSGDLERVEILRGSSAEYGGASSVTVNLVMKKALSKRTTALKAAVGFRGNEPTGQMTWTENGGDGGFAWSLPITLNLHRNPTQGTTDRQAFPNGVRNVWQQERDEGLYTFREFVLSPRMTWKDSGDSLTISPLFFDGLGKRNSDTTSTDLLAPSSDTRSSRETNNRRMLRLRADGEKNLSGAKLTGRMSLNQGNRTVDLVRESTVANVASTATEHSNGKETEYNMALRLDKPQGEHLLAVGLEHIDLRRNDEQSFSGSFVGASTSEASERHSIAWVQDDWSLQQSVVLTMGVRGENMRLGSDGVSQQHGRLLPSIAVRWEPAQQWLLRSSLGAGLKLPRLDELSNTVTRSVAANTPLEADRRGNATLSPERSLNYEAVLERYLDQEAGVFGANLYVRSTEDFIERRVQLEGVRWVDRPQNEGRALHWGWELDGKVRTDNFGWKGATVKAHLTLPNARVHDTRLSVTRMARDTPDYAFSAGVDQSLPMWQSSYGVALQMSGPSRTDIPNEQSGTTNAKTTLDAFWLYKLTPKFNLRLSGQNLLAAKTVRETVYMNGADTYRLRTEDKGVRALLVTLEGRW
jgi:iron complex outermembrane receptor protein